VSIAAGAQELGDAIVSWGAGAQSVRLTAAMIDHVKLFVADATRSRAFYEQALEPLGYRVLLEPAEGVVGMGSRFPDFWVAEASAATSAHVAFRVAERTAVDAFHAAALAAGGTDNGPPGLRPQYHAGYYSAFVLDPDGNNVEAVHHTYGG
jgi:catechol 2,3-dioxygenase-like lactoylglutathione lyase family enzyme